MIQQGIMEIDYRSHSHLKFTELSEKVLHGESVRLVAFETVKKRQTEQKQKAKIKVKLPLDESELNVDESLLDNLKKLRREMASEIGKPPFIVFSDVSLKDMASRKPSNMEEFFQVKGVGEFKAERYGERFLRVISGK